MLPKNYPKKIHPALATLVDQAPIGDEWLHEVKFDGYRLICFIEDKKIRFVTRNQIDWSKKIPTMVTSIEKLKLKPSILDGELVAINKKNKSDFQLLQNSMNSQEPVTLMYFVFDLIYYNGTNLLHTPLLERKRLLKKILGSKTKSLIQYSDHMIGHGDHIFKKSCKLGLEGIVSKNIHSLYEQKRTHHWQKVKCKKRQEFMICGFTEPQGARKHFGALLLGVYSSNGKLKYCGNVGTGFSDATLNSLNHLLKKYSTNQKQFEHLPKDLKNISWVKPKLIAEVEFSEWTNDGHLRHPSFKGIRSDKQPKEITREMKSKIGQK